MQLLLPALLTMHSGNICKHGLKSQRHKPQQLLINPLSRNTPGSYFTPLTPNPSAPQAKPPMLCLDSGPAPVIRAGFGL